MADEQVVQVSRLLDERGLSSFQIKLLAWSIFIVFIDGYDIGAIAFAAPALVKSFGVAPSGLGPVFSASLAGILFGSAAFGWVGDRFGRRSALISSMLVFGVFTLMAAYATSLKNDVLAAVARWRGHRRRYPECRCHQCRVRAE